MKSNNSLTCKNCNTVFEGNYCNNCGQSAKTHRITWKEILHYLTHALFHTDKGFFYTIKELIIRPGFTIKDYLEGKRIKHFNPILFLIIIGSITTYFYSSLHLKLPNAEIDLERIEHISSTIGHKYFAFIGCLFIFFLTITDFILYRKHGYLIPEIVISNTYQMVMILLFSLLMLPLFSFQDYIFNNNTPFFELRLVLKGGTMLYLFYTRYQLYNAKNDKITLFKIVFQVTIAILFNNYIVPKLMFLWYS